MADTIDAAIAELGHSLGMAELRFDDNRVELHFEQSGVLFLERDEQQLLLSLLRPLPPYEGHRLSEALALCHYRQGLPLPIRVGLLGDDRLVFFTQISAADCNLPTLERALGLLNECHHQIAS